MAVRENQRQAPLQSLRPLEVTAYNKRKDESFEPVSTEDLRGPFSAGDSLLWSHLTSQLRNVAL